MKSTIGLIGLGTMGAALAKNLANHGFKISVWNRSYEKITELANSANNDNIYAPKDFEDFIESLEKPRKIILMVTAGEPMQKVLHSLYPALQYGDIVIDGGNSYFRDTEMYQKELAPRGIKFLGMGISGGEKGALWGPSMMIGGEDLAAKQVEPILKSIAALDFDRNACAEYVGEGGSGHYVKMVHNGIEYAEMQIIAEAYDLLRQVYKLKNEEIAGIFEKFNEGESSSFLLESAVKVLLKKEDGLDLIDVISDKAEQKGTGRWTSEESLHLGIATPSITSAVYMRALSSFKEERLKVSGKYNFPNKVPNLFISDFVEMLEQAIYLARISNFEQGFALLRAASLEYSYNLDLSKVARVWQGGCIIRSRVLSDISESFKGETRNLYESPILGPKLEKAHAAMQSVVILAVENSVPCMVFSACLSHFDSLARRDLPLSMIQGLRDLFGAHGYERKDKEGKFHSSY